MAPLAWDKVTRRFRKTQELKERAHGDGMQVGLDSPEAFEEVVWRSLWPKKYKNHEIGLWTLADQSPEAVGLLRDHLKKIVALRNRVDIERAR